MHFDKVLRTDIPIFAGTSLTSPNNVIKAVATNDKGEVTETVNTSYEYYANGYALKGVQQSSAGGTTTMGYEYECK